VQLLPNTECEIPPTAAICDTRMLTNVNDYGRHQKLWMAIDMDDDDGRLMMSSSLECMADAGRQTPIISLVGVKICYSPVLRDTHADESAFIAFGGLEGGTRRKCTSIAVGQYGQKAPQKRAIPVIFAVNKPGPIDCI
jgi:hypothetical protein